MVEQLRLSDQFSQQESGGKGTMETSAGPVHSSKEGLKERTRSRQTLEEKEGTLR